MSKASSIARRPQLLLVSLFLPQAKADHAGGRLVFEILRELSAKFDIHLFTRLAESQAKDLGSLAPYCKSIQTHTYPDKDQRGLVDNLQLIKNYLDFSRRAQALVKSGAYDLVQVEWVEAAIRMRRANTPMVLIAHDVMTKPAQRSFEQARGLARISNWLRFRLTRMIELKLMSQFDVTFTVSEYDKQYLLGLNPGSLDVRVRPAPAGMDITPQLGEPIKDSILFLASFKYRIVNVEAALWFAQKVFPRVQAEIPGATFVIAGYGPPPELHALAKANPAIQVTGYVDDIDQCYKSAQVFVAPILIGGGVIVKVLDGLAAARPIVTTTYGNEGIGASNERHLLIADTPQEFAAQVVRLLKDPQAAHRMGLQGRDFVRQEFSLERIASDFEACYRELSDSHRAPS